jgi:hypothetical protein
MRQMLETQYGVDRGFTEHLAPLLERFAASEPSAEEWDHLLKGLVAAYRACQRGGAESPDEVKVLAGDVAAELRKIEESLKVLGVYLMRIQQRLRGDASGQFLH